MPVGTPITDDEAGGYYVIKADVLDEISQPNYAAYSSHMASTVGDDAHMTRRALQWDAKVDAAFANMLETVSRFGTSTTMYSRLKALGAKWVVAEMYRSHGMKDSNAKDANGISGFMTALREEAQSGLDALVMQAGQLSARPAGDDYRLTQGRLPGSGLCYGRYW